MKRCSNCVLPETFPGISFDENGVCNFCNAQKERVTHLTLDKAKYQQKFEELIAQHPNNGSYDCIMAYSGGKDSSYTLYLLKYRFGLKTLAITFDNGFLSPFAFKNIRNVTNTLEVDHMFIKPKYELLKRMFVASSKEDLYSPKTLERASTICTSCMGLVKFSSLKVAIEKHIPFIVYGWSPGQAPLTSSIFKNNGAMMVQMQRAIRAPLEKATGPEIGKYFIDEKIFSLVDSFPYNIHPLAFLDYNENGIYITIKNLGWEKPEDTDANSTNCLLNSFANRCHIKKHHFHPYAFEMANLVRLGYVPREEAIKKLESHDNPEVINYVKKRLGIEHQLEPC